MAEVTLYNLRGEKTGVLPLPDAIFAVDSRAHVVHTAVMGQEKNAREAWAHTKTRGDVSGGGKKPWKQKGTGRARHGSSRSPIWIGGGVTHGPRNDRDYGVKVNKRLRRLALAMVLSDRLRNGALVAVEDFQIVEAKTKAVAAARTALPGAGAKALVLTTAQDAAFIRAARNLPATTTIAARSLNVRDLVNFPTIIASKDALTELIQTIT